MRRRKDELDAAGVIVVVVTFETNTIALDYARSHEMPWPVLVDPDRGLYAAYGIGRGSLRAIWGPANWAPWLRGVLRGHLPRLATADTLQRGGDVVVGPNGIVALHHVSDGPADRPTVDAILQAATGDNRPF